MDIALNFPVFFPGSIHYVRYITNCLAPKSAFWKKNDYSDFFPAPFIYIHILYRIGIIGISFIAFFININILIA